MRLEMMVVFSFNLLISVSAWLVPVSLYFSATILLLLFYMIGMSQISLVRLNSVEYPSSVF